MTKVFESNALLYKANAKFGSISIALSKVLMGPHRICPGNRNQGPSLILRPNAGIHKTTNIIRALIIRALENLD
jgi:hypothetical protein